MKKQLTSFDKKIAMAIDCPPGVGWMWKWEGIYSKRYFHSFDDAEKDLRKYLAKR